MASDRRSSMTSLRSAVSRTSTGPKRPASSQSEERPTLSPLNTGPIHVPTLAPPVPPKSTPSLPKTPQRKPVQYKSSPLASEAYSSPTMMPGAFPEEGVQPPGESIPDSTRSTKRLSGMKQFLPKALRKSLDTTSATEITPNSARPTTPGSMRPTTPGAESAISSTPPKPSLRARVSQQFFPRSSPNNARSTTPSGSMRPTTPGADSLNSSYSPKPSLKGRVSSSFWQRKSSLNAESRPGEDGRATSHSRSPSGSRHGTIPQDPPKPSLRKRISGTFRRNSNLSSDFTAGGNGPASPRSPRTNGASYDAIPEDSRPESPVFGRNTPTMKKRKSGMFGRRTSSLTLSQTLQQEKLGWGKRGESMPINGRGRGYGHANGNGYASAADMDPANIMERENSKTQKRGPEGTASHQNGKVSSPPMLQRLSFEGNHPPPAPQRVPSHQNGKVDDKGAPSEAEKEDWEEYEYVPKKEKGPPRQLTPPPTLQDIPRVDYSLGFDEDFFFKGFKYERSDVEDELK